MSLFRSPEEKKFETVLMKLIGAVRVFLVFRKEWPEHIKSFLYDARDETIEWPQPILDHYYKFDRLLTLASHISDSFPRDSLELVTKDSPMDAYELWDFMFMLYFLKDFDNQLKRLCQQVRGYHESFAEAMRVVEDAKLDDKLMSRATSFFTNVKDALGFVDVLLEVNETVLADELFFVKLFSIMFRQQKKLKFREGANKYACKIITFPVREIGEANYMKFFPVFNYYLKFYSRKLVLGKYNVSEKIISDQKRVVGMIAEALQNVVRRKARLFRMLFGSSHNLQITIQVYPLMKESENGVQSNIGGYYRFEHKGNLNRPVIAIAMDKMDDLADYERTIFHELIHFTDQPNIFRKSNEFEGEFEDIDELRAEGLTTIGELFMGHVRNIHHVYSLEYEEDFFKEFHDNMYSLAQTMSMVILLHMVGRKEIHKLKEKEVISLFKEGSFFRRRLEEGFRRIKLMNFKLYVKNYLEACKSSETKVIPIIEELAKRLEYV